MDTTPRNGRSRIALSPADEHELADYLDEFISALLAERRREKAAPSVRAVTHSSRPPVTQGAPASVKERAQAPPSEEERRYEPADGARTRRFARASMHQELSALFAATRHRPPLGPTATREPGAYESPQPGCRPHEPRPLRQRFMPAAQQEPAPYRSGLGAVDDRLGGGFGAGLHLVSGRARSGKTALMEAVAWDAAASQRPVLYYALKESLAATRDRLTVTLAGFMGFSTITPEALRNQTLGAGDHIRLRSLERVLQTAVLTRLSLIETFHASGDPFTEFVEDIRVRSQEALELHDEIPAVLIDDAQHLMRAVRMSPLADLLERLDEFLTTSSLTGLITVTTPDRPAQGIDGLPVHTALALAPTPGSPHDFVDYVDLTVLTNTHGGWTGTIPLLFDRRSGVFVSRS